jgi:hypothetical protein
MTDPSAPAVHWHARGLLFENCSCQLVCPGHLHFQQLCTHERCLGYWAIRIDHGRFGEVPLDGLKAVAAFDSPQQMAAGGWTGRLIIDETAGPEARRAIEAILTGQAGGPWAVLARFVARRLDTRYLPITVVDAASTKSASIPGLFETTVTDIRGRDRSRPVRFENIFNQIHAPEQVLATGVTRYDDGVIVIANDKTHGLHSSFDWRVGPS